MSGATNRAALALGERRDRPWMRAAALAPTAPAAALATRPRAGVLVAPERAAGERPPAPAQTGATADDAS